MPRLAVLKSDANLGIRSVRAKSSRRYRKLALVKGKHQTYQVTQYLHAQNHVRQR